MTKLLVSLYVGAAVVANILVAWLGPSATIWTAFLLIGLNITVRDRLHDIWQGRELALRMLMLIASAAAISFAIVPAAGRVGVASMLAFIAAEMTDAVIYQGLRHRRWLVRANASNVGASIVDSLLFPTIAFSSFIP